MDGRLYAVGGKDERGNKLRSVERYDPRCVRRLLCTSLCIFCLLALHMRGAALGHAPCLLNSKRANGET